MKVERLLRTLEPSLVLFLGDFEVIGQTISHYKITEKLGEGGMGVVYKAEDTRLKRTVALKFLPKGLEAHEPERARFLQEAQAASALNHPNICAIHTLGEHEDQQFIDMEYVDGKTLRQLIPIQKIEDAITYAIRIGEALEEAHSHGIVHRDVKPDNVMVTARNQVKVMDFGLAKLKGSLKLTKTSSTVGTLAYMAPEQIQGGEADARSDIFSFGIVLYEMLTGHLPFRGEHEAAILYSVVNEEPVPVANYRPESSPDLNRIIRRALEKDPWDRYQSVADMVSELRKVLKESTRVVRPPTPQRAERPAEPDASGAVDHRRVGTAKHVLLLAIGIASILSIVVLYFLLFRTRTVELNPDMKFQTLQLSFTEISYSGISADGNWIAFPAADANGKWDVYYMNIAVGEPHRVTFDSSLNVNRNASADISFDGGMIVYSRFNPAINNSDAYVIPSIGGRAKKIIDDCNGARWSPDGSRIGYMRRTGRGRLQVWSVRPDGSDQQMELLDTLAGNGRICTAWSRSGDAIAWLRTFPAGYQEVMRRDLTTGKESQLTFDRKNIDEVCWASNDQIIFSSNKSGNTNLWMVPASGGQSVQITKGSGPDVGMSISANGKRLLYIQRQEAGHLWLGRTDGSGCRQITTDERNIVWPTFSPDAQQIAFGMSDNDPLKPWSHIYICDREGSNRRQITTGEEIAQWPSWSPDGRRIAFYRLRSGQPLDSAIVYTVDPADPGTPRPLGRGLVSHWIDSATLRIFNPYTNSGSRVTLDETSTPVETRDSLSLWPMRDGKNVLLLDVRPGKAGWYVAPARGGRIPDGAVPRKLLSYIVPPTLSPDQKYFYYSLGDNLLRRVPLSDGNAEPLPGTFPGLFAMFSLSRDGKEIVYSDRRVNAKLVLIENVFK